LWPSGLRRLGRRFQRSVGRHGSAARIVEPQGAGRVTARPPPTFVDQPVVGVAQQDQVVQVRRPAVGPVDQVVGMEPPLPSAPWEPAPPSVPRRRTRSRDPGTRRPLLPMPTGRPARSRTHSILLSQASRRMDSEVRRWPPLVSANQGAWSGSCPLRISAAAWTTTVAGSGPPAAMSTRASANRAPAGARASASRDVLRPPGDGGLERRALLRGERRMGFGDPRKVPGAVGDPNPLACRSPRHPVSGGQPRGHRRRSVSAPQLKRSQSATALRARAEAAAI
jgi:hypothetical protein